jgi:hypothetical protein
MSQMHVSRLRAHALGYLRSRLLDLQEHPVASGGLFRQDPLGVLAPTGHRFAGLDGVPTAVLAEEPA